MKKILILMCAVLMLIMTALPVFAASSVSAKLSVSDKTVNAGDKITITVSATVDSCGSGGVDISFDSSVFELTSGDWVLKNTFMSDFSVKTKDGVFAFESAKSVSGKVFKFVLKVKSSAPIGKSTVTVKLKADSKSVSKTTTITVACDHTYSDKCDTNCNKCNAKRKVTHTWDSGTIIKAADCTTVGSAKYTCKVCGETKTETVAVKDHIYDNACDTACNACNATRQITHAFAWTCDTAEHWQACTVCGEEVDRGAHAIVNSLTSNDLGHGNACSVCSLIPDVETHVFDSACDSSCELCGFERTVTHIYSQRYSCNAEDHWYACVLCDTELERNPHTPGDAATETTDQICLQCGFIIQPAGNHVHTMGSDWLYDADGHWYMCRCGELTEPAAHAWDAGTLNEETGIVTYFCTECNDFRTEIFVPETEPVTEEEPKPETFRDIPHWMLLAAGLCLSLLINLILFIRVIVLGKRIKRSDWQ